MLNQFVLKKVKPCTQDNPTKKKSENTSQEQLVSPSDVIAGDPWPLHTAAQKGQNDLIDLLVKQGLNPAQKDDRGRTALHLAAAHGQKATIDYLVKKYQLNLAQESNDGLTSLHAAANKGRNATIDFLVKKYHLDPAQKNNNGYTALHAAALNGQNATIDFLVENYRLNPAQKSNHGLTSLHVAAFSGQNATIDFLVGKYQLKPAQKMNNGATALHAAALTRQNGTIRHLIDQYQLNPAEKDNKGLTALDHAKKGGKTETVNLLASYIADFKDIADRFAPAEREEILRFIEATPDIVTPCAGIAAKYFGKAKLPALPKKPREASNRYVYSNACELVPIVQCAADLVEKRIPTPISIGFFNAQYYTTKAALPHSDEKVVFVRGGRKQEALIPTCNSVRCIDILTQAEFSEIGEQIPSDVDIVVVEQIQSKVYGGFDNLSALAARRLVPFILGYHLNLPHFVVMDDNITSIKFNADTANQHEFAAVYDLLMRQLGNLLTVYVSTDSPKEVRAGELGSKLCLINMQKLRGFLATIEEVFLLFPFACEADYWGGDYYQQLMFFEMSQPLSQGYQILDKSLIALTRSQTSQNAFAKTGARATLFEAIPGPILSACTEQQRHWMGHVRQRLNEIILENRQSRLAAERAFENTNLLKAHARANEIIEAQMIAPTMLEDTGRFKERFVQKIANIEFETDYLRAYQKEAIRSVAGIDRAGLLKLATGTGKSFIQAALAQIAYHCGNQHVIIVTPHITLVNQFYESIQSFNERCIAENESLQVPRDAIVKISSHGQSVPVKALLKNAKISSQKSIMIICADSFAKLQQEANAFLEQHVSMILLDEYHDYAAKANSLMSEINEEIVVIALTATPPQTNLFPLLYEYTRAQAVMEQYLAPVIADKVGLEYSPENVERLIEYLPRIIKSQYHPGYEDKAKLKDCKGVVYLPSIEDCEKAMRVLKQQGIACYAIHSKNPKHQEELEAFKESEAPGVLVAAYMLGFGFDCVDLGWAIVGRDAKDDNFYQKNNMEQICAALCEKIVTK